MSALSEYVAAVKRQQQILNDAMRRDREAELNLSGALTGHPGLRRKNGRRVWTRTDKRLAQLRGESREIEEEEQFREEFILNLPYMPMDELPKFRLPATLTNSPPLRLHSRFYRAWHRWPAPDHRPALAEAK